MSEESTPDPDQKLIEEHVAKLCDHFDSVRIFTTRDDGASGQTAGWTFGGGNWFAQIGQIIEWTDARRQEVKNKVRPEDEDD